MVRGSRLDYPIVLGQLFALRLPFVWSVGALLLGGALLLTACGGKASGSSPASTQTHACAYAGKSHADGDSFPSTDGCNTCSCNDGEVSCTLIGCDPGPSPTGPPVSCEQVDVFYQQLLDENKSCDPHEFEPCSFRVSTGLGCGCDTFVNPDNWDTARAGAFATHYQSLACGSGPCGMCPPSPLRGKCTVMGRCEDTSEPKPGPGCKVNGVSYSDGSSGIPDPVSCNVCSCNAGQLSCTEKDCPQPCPAGTVLAVSCAQCRAAGACELIEHACYPTCTDTCADGVCINGACVPGMCD